MGGYFKRDDNDGRAEDSNSHQPHIATVSLLVEHGGIQDKHSHQEQSNSFGDSLKQP